MDDRRRGAFVLALTLSFANTRFSERRAGTLAEANAIGTAWLRGQCEQLFAGDYSDDWFTGLSELLAAVREFYRHAANFRRSVLFTSDEILDDIYPPSSGE